MGPGRAYTACSYASRVGTVLIYVVLAYHNNNCNSRDYDKPLESYHEDLNTLGVDGYV